MTLKLIAAAGALALSASAAQAISVNNGDVICEDAGNGSFTNCTNTIGDLGESPSETFELDLAAGESAFLNGFVRGRDNQFADAAFVTGSGTYKLSFELIGDVIEGDDFDAFLKFGVNGAPTTTAATVSNDPLNRSFATTLSLMSGTTYSFSIDAANGDYSDGSAMAYTVAIAAVPLPAGGLLLLGGLGALGAAARRRRKAA